MRNLAQTAAVDADAPDFVAIAALRVEVDALPIEGPRRSAVLLGIVGELPDLAAVSSGEEEVLLSSDVRKRNPLSIRRNGVALKVKQQHRSAEDRCRLAGHLHRNRIEWHTPYRIAHVDACVSERAGITREAEVRSESRRQQS